MTEAFVSRVGILDEYATGSTYNALDVIEVSLEAIDEGVRDSRIISTALSYTHSMYFELLENIKNGLLKAIQTMLTALNSYYMNNAKLCQKYRNVIAKGLEKQKTPILHDTFEYPDSKGYPNAIRATAVENEVVRIQRDIANNHYTPEEVAYRIDSMIEDFGRKVLDFSPDPWDLKDSIQEIVTRRVKGKQTTITIDVNTLDDWIKSISEYRKDREDLMALKKDLVEDYEILKRTMKSVTKPDKMLPNRSPIKQAYDPEMEEFHQHEYARYSDIHTEMMRLFTAYITIYKESFSRKLELLDEKINDQRNTLTEVLTRTGTLAAINTKSPVMTGNAPMPYNPQPVS